MTALEIVLIRHGEQIRHPGDPGLSHDGVRSAQRAAAQLTREPAAALYTSPLRRAAETAAVIGTAVGLPVTPDPRLAERMNWGPEHYRDFEHFLAEWRRCAEDRHHRPPDGDSSAEAGRRMLEFLDGLPAAAGPVLAVTHGGIVVDLLRELFGDVEVRRLGRDLISDGVPHCSLTTLVRGSAGFRVSGVGR